MSFQKVHFTYSFQFFFSHFEDLLYILTCSFLQLIPILEEQISSSFSGCLITSSIFVSPFFIFFHFFQILSLSFILFFHFSPFSSTFTLFHLFPLFFIFFLFGFFRSSGSDFNLNVLISSFSSLEILIILIALSEKKILLKYIVFSSSQSLSNFSCTISRAHFFQFSMIF